MSIVQGMFDGPDPGPAPRREANAKRELHAITNAERSLDDMRQMLTDWMLQDDQRRAVLVDVILRGVPIARHEGVDWTRVDELYSGGF